MKTVEANDNLSKSNYQDAQSKDLEYYPQDHEIEDYHLSTKPYEINEVTIIRKTIATFATQEIDSSDEEDMEEADASSRSFLSRLIAIPLIHDGVWSTQHLMRQYYVGRIVADQTELAVRSISHYVENSMANNLGNRSLDLVEQKFPMVHTPTQEVKNKIGSALQRVRLAPNQASRRALTALDRYLRSDDKQLLRRIVDNTCPNQKTLNKWMAQIKAMRARLPRPLQHLLNPLLNTAQQEYDMLRLEFQQTHTPIERARNIVSLQKEVIVMPLWYSLSDLMYN
ncbi:hypothetical protein DFQ28_010537, partial [Apophysomyces sp. BC1034]